MTLQFRTLSENQITENLRPSREKVFLLDHLFSRSSALNLATNKVNRTSQACEQRARDTSKEYRDLRASDDGKRPMPLEIEPEAPRIRRKRPIYATTLFAVTSYRTALR